MLDSHWMLIQNCIVAIISIGYHTTLPLVSIRKTSFQASLVTSALSTLHVFLTLFLLFVHGGVCCLLTAKKLVWFPWHSWLVEPRDGDLVSKGSSSSSALQDGAPRAGLLSRASNVYISSWDGSSTASCPSSTREDFCHCPAACGDSAPNEDVVTEATSLPDPSSRAGFPSLLTGCFVLDFSAPLQGGQCCLCPHPAGAGSRVWQ